MKQDLLAKGFSLPTLLMVEYPSGYLPYISVELVLNWFSTHVSDDWRYMSAVARYTRV